MTEPKTSTITDAFHRPLRDLRISVTDRCNFRCRYCMPREVFGASFRFLPRKELLTFEEIERTARVFASLGVDKIRVTGGEPLLRHDVEHLIERLSAIPGIEDLAMTTNGSMLAAKAEALKAAGLKRVTVSLDALDDATFMSMNDVGFPPSRVLDAIDAAAGAGLSPVKINAVVRRHVNEHAVLDLAEHFRGTGHIVRFIEYMDVGNANGWKMADVVPAAEIVSTIDRRWPLEALAPARPGEVATRYRYLDGQGEIGVIASVTQPFCRGCGRLRLSPEGQLYTCLFGTHGHDLRALLRGDATDEELRAHIAALWSVRDDRYSELRTAQTPKGRKIEMSHIGG